MHKWSAPAAIAVVLTWSSLTAFSQQQPPPTFKSGLDLLTLEASVRDPSGRPVTDLQPSDFTVTVDGQPRRVLNARLYGSGEDVVMKAGTPVPRFAKSTDAVPGRAVVFAVDRDSIRSGTEKPILDTAASIIATFSPADAVERPRSASWRYRVDARSRRGRGGYAADDGDAADAPVVLQRVVE